ncbi:MAG: hypothetical protein C0594_09215 [Marinilabiliales bacterium]|nr:MAG: hypothetical protein C0594_09215 [Marinilabiliales bacterium]
MKKSLLIVIYFLLGTGILSAQVMDVITKERLEKKYQKGEGIKAFTNREVAFRKTILDGSPIFFKVKPFESLELLDYYNGKWAARKDSTYGFIPNDAIISDFKIESYRTIWENAVKKELRELEVRERYQNREKDWQEQFSLNEYSTDHPQLVDKVTNPFDDLQFINVIAYNFNLRSEKPSSIIRNGHLNETFEFPGKDLTDDQVKELISLINDTVNYGKKPPKLFNPKIGLVFYRGEEIIAYIDVDLDNMQMKSSFLIPAQHYHNFLVNQAGKKVNKSFHGTAGFDIKTRMGLSRKGKDVSMEYFRKLKLNVSNYPKVLTYGVSAYGSLSGYYNKVQKLTLAAVFNYSRNTITIGPKLWLGSYFSSADFASGLQITYQYNLSKYGRRFKQFLFYDFDYGVYRSMETEERHDDFVKDIHIENFINQSIGVGIQYRIFSRVYFKAGAGIGLGLESVTDKMMHSNYPEQDYENKHGFFDGFFFDSPSYHLRAGLYYSIPLQKD